MSSSVTVQKVFSAFWNEKTSQKTKSQECSDSDSDVEEQRKKRKKRMRKKTSKKQRKPKEASAFRVRHAIPTRVVDEKTNPEIQCYELNFRPTDDNKEELIASTTFFNSRNKKRQTYDHVSPFDWPVVRAIIQDDAPTSFDIHAQNKRNKERPYMEAVSRAYEESFLRPPDTSKGERPCLAGKDCEGLQIICENDNAFILTEFFLPSQWKKIQETGRRPVEVNLCLMCMRNEIARALLNSRADQMAIREGVTLQPYYNIVGLPGEYDVSNCICSDPAVHEGLLEPIVLHQQCAYKYDDSNGKRRYIQWKYMYPSSSGNKEGNSSFQ